ncbi:hypothetical protein BH09BAC3_BH09BAC3_10010 [soil metagenome]
MGVLWVSGRTKLVIDDENQIQRLLRISLSSQNYNAPQSANSRKAAGKLPNSPCASSPVYLSRLNSELDSDFLALRFTPGFIDYRYGRNLKS